MKLKTVRLYGKLGTLFGREYKLAVRNAQEAVRALCVMIEGFEEYMSHPDQQYAVFYGKQNITQDELDYPSGRDDIRIAPVPKGSKRGGIFAVVVGVVLVAAGFFTGGATWGPAMMMLGTGMAVAGAMMMLSPQPKSGIGEFDAADDRASSTFNGVVNTQAQGNPVPLLYGEAIVGSSVISGGVYVEDRG